MFTVKKTISPFLMKGLLLCLLAISMSACKKTESPTVEEEAQPFADFTTDKSEYFNGEIIHLSSTSTNASRFIWTLPDGQTGKSSTLDYPTTTAQNLSFKLEAFSPKSTKSDYVVKIIKVKPAEGQAVFYTQYQYYAGSNVDVYLDGLFFVQITLSSNYTTIPTCGQQGYPTLNIAEGQHAVQVKANSNTLYSGYIDIVKNACTAVRI